MSEPSLAGEIRGAIERFANARNLSLQALVADRSLAEHAAVELAPALRGREAIPPDTARELGEALLEWIHQRNQFLMAGSGARAALEQLCDDVLQGALAKSALPLQALERRLEALLEIAQSKLRGLIANPSDAQAVPPEVVSSEYSPELQLSLLGVKVHELVDPILDLGAGTDEKLCVYLRSLGRNAIGLDRHASRAEGSRSIAADWLEFEFAPRSFGTILSHQAFSLHFWHQHLKSEAGARRYAEKYVQIMKSLVKGGSFVYTPGLPFMEEHFRESEFIIVKRPFPAEWEGLREKLRGLEVMLGGEASYACEMRRTR